MKRPILFLLSLALLLSVGCAMREAAVLQPVATASVLPLQPAEDSVSAPTDAPMPVPTALPSDPVSEPTPIAEQVEAPAAGAVVYSAPEDHDFVFVLPEGWTYDMTEDGADLRQLDDPLNFLPVTVEIDSLPRTDLSMLFAELDGHFSEEGFAFAAPVEFTVAGRYAGQHSENLVYVEELDLDILLHAVAWETNDRTYTAVLIAPTDDDGAKVAFAALLDSFMTAQAYLDAGHTAPEPTPVPENASAEDDPYTLPTSAPAETVTMALDNAVLVDEDGLKATVLGFTEGWFGPALSLELTNNTNRAVTFTIDRPAVNGYMMDTISLYATVPAGKTVTQEVSVYDNELLRCGIEKIADMEFSLRVTAELWDTVYVSPRLRLETEAAQTYTQTYADKGTPLYDADGLTVLYTGLETDAWFGQTVVLTFVNASERSLAVSLRDCSINGIPAETLFSVILLPGTRAVSVCYLSPETGSSFGEAYRTGAFGFHIYDAETYDTLADAAPVEVMFD